jgi:putative peptidoglycan lipid II flippase
MNLLNALAKVGSMTMISRILGFVRDTLIARVFGAGMMTDAFFVAFKIPNLLRRLFAEGAFAQACWRNIKISVGKKKPKR